MADNVFSDLIPQTGSKPPTTGGFTGYIPGVAKPKEPEDPLDRRNKELDVQLKEARVAKGDAADDPMGLAKVEQVKASGFLERALSANALYGEGVMPRGAVGQTAFELLPKNFQNAKEDPARRVTNKFAEEFIAAVLRYESGAAIPDPELDRAYRRYFPVAGDTAADLAGKAKLREIAIRGLQAGAGPLGEPITSRFESGKADLAAFRASILPDEADATPPANTAPPADRTARAEQAEPDAGVVEMTDDQKKAYAAFWKANPDPTPQKLGQFFESIGAMPPGEAVGNAEAIIKAVKNGDGYSTALDRTLVLRAELAKQDAVRGGGTLAESDAETLAKQGQTLGLSDEAAGVGRGISKALQLENPIEGYRLGRDAERLRIEDARRQMGYGGTAIEIGSSLLSANPASALRGIVTAKELAREGAKGGAYGGALAGYGSGEGLQDSLLSAGIGGAGGAAVGAGVGALAGRFIPEGNPELAAAAASENVRVPQALVTENRRAINRLGVLEANDSTAPVIQRGLDETTDDIAAGVSRLGRGGTAQDRAGAGEIVREAAKKIKKDDADAATQAYQAAEAIDGDPMVDAVAMRAKLDAEITRLQRAPGTNEDTIRALQKYRRDIEQPIPLSALRDMRTTLREGASADLASTSGQKRAARRMVNVIEGTKEDIQKSLTPEAWQAWSAADAQYAQNMDFIKTSLRPFVGKDFDQLPAEAIFDRVRAAANSNGRALASLHRRLTPDQSRDIAATFADSLGRRSPDEEFSAALFKQQARRLSPSARETIFGPSGAASFNNLLRLSRGLERFKGQINTSKTGRPVRDIIRRYGNQLLVTLLGGGGAVLTGGIGGAAAGAAAGTAIAVGSAMRSGLSAKALMRPAVTRWLLDVQKVNTPRQAQQVVNRLSTVIAREPALSGELQPLQQYLQQALTAPAVASEPAEGGQ